MRQQHAALKRRPLLPWPDASEQSARPDVGPRTIVAVPTFTGTRLLETSRSRRSSPTSTGRSSSPRGSSRAAFPPSSIIRSTAPAARELYDHATTLLDRIVAERLLTIRGVYGFWPAQSMADDIVVYEARPASREPSRSLQHAASAGAAARCATRTCRSPTSSRRETAASRTISARSPLPAGIGAEDLAAAFERDQDDYHAIMVKALADRLAEASAEWLHARARADWGYGADERSANEDLIAERYRGIRPAFGYPACPDHSEKYKLFDLLQADRAGISLTESCAMAPAASVSGLYFAHPQARYFTVGRIGRDQVQDYAARKGVARRGGGALAARPTWGTD